MSKQKQKKSRKNTTEKLVLATATIKLIHEILEIIKMLNE